MKICFYLENKNLNNVDLSKPYEGNPGIGGTQYMFLLISYYLKYYYSDIEVVILAPNIKTLPIELVNIECKDAIEAIEICKNINADIFIFKGPYNERRLFELIDRYKIKSIMWSHNFESILSIRLVDKCEYLKRNICVSKEQYDKLRDTKIFNKSDYIHNALDFSPYNRKIQEKENIVTFMGGLRNTKGFHVLAEIWSDVVKEVPDAKLYIIGGSKLYDRNATNGTYGVAESKYEQRFIKYLLDENKNIMKNVKFLGVLGGKEKLDTMNCTKVGVANPTGYGETFCISAIEFEALGIPVVSAKKNGLLETIIDGKSGILTNNKKKLSKAIIRLLNDNQLNKSMGDYGYSYVRNQFDIKHVCIKWRKILDDVYYDENPIINLDNDNIKYNLKWIREINRKIQKISIFKNIPSILEYEERIFSKIRKI